MADFDISFTAPELYFDDEYLWFRIDEYATKSFAGVGGNTFFCQHCEEGKPMNVFYQEVQEAVSFLNTPEFPTYCVGCTYKHLQECPQKLCMEDRWLHSIQGIRTQYALERAAFICDSKATARKAWR